MACTALAVATKTQAGGAEPYQNWSGDSSKVILLQSDVIISDCVAPVTSGHYLHRSTLFHN